MEEKKFAHCSAYDLWHGEAGVLFPRWEISPVMRAKFTDLVDPISELNQIGDDIWYSTEPVESHSDSTREGCITLGIVLRNDLGLFLRAEGRDFPLPLGTVYRINGLLEHAAPQVERHCENGKFVIRVWDYPRRDEPLPVQFAQQALATKVPYYNAF